MLCVDRSSVSDPRSFLSAVITHILFEGSAGCPSACKARWPDFSRQFGRTGRLKSGLLGASRRRRACARPVADLWVITANSSVDNLFPGGDNRHMPRTLLLPQTIYLAMLTHARSDYPNEACGLLRGRGNRASGFLAARNVALTPRTDFEVDPESLLRALEWEEEGDELIAIFHSHPASPPYPSAVDVGRAFYFDSFYLILSLQNREKPQLQGYSLRPEAVFEGDIARKMQKELPFKQVRPGLWGYYVPPDAPPSSGFRDMLPDGVAFYLIFEDNAGQRSPVIRLISVQSAPITIRL